MRIKVQIWDTAGQEKYKSIVSHHYRKALGALLVFDLTRRETFIALQRFLYELRQFAEPDCTIYLVGNKSDLLDEKARAVSLEEIESYAHDNRLKYVETSAFTSVNVNETFLNILEDVYIQKKKSIVRREEYSAPIKVKAKRIDRDDEPDSCNC